MSANRRLCLSRKRERKLCGEGIRDISDDFQEAATVFRLPKRLRIGKSQGKPKSSALDPDAQECPVSSIKKEPSDQDITITSQQGQHLEKLGSETSEKDSDLQEIEKMLCTESEKLCPSCKLIVPSAMFADHFKECLQKFKLTKRGSDKKFPVANGEGETGEQEEQQLVLPCPVCKKPFKSKTQRVSHIKACAQGNGLTSEQLLLASRLLEKQTEEWNELGLPTALQLPNTRPKVHHTVKHTRDLNDPDIAMAVALSRSIAEEDLESRISREEKLLALGMEDIVNEDRKVKPVLLLPPDPANQMRKGTKNRKGCCQLLKTPLTTRSVEERERLISEKVAVLLTSADTTKVGWTNSGTPKQSRKLSCLMNKQCQLWEAARSGADEPLHSFYVPELEPYIYPKETVIGSLFKQLSQVPGRLNTTTLHTLDEESESECEMEETSEVEEFCTQMALAELMDSQEEWDITLEKDWEEAAEGMGNQGFLLSSQTSKTQGKSKFNTSILKNYSGSHLCEGAFKENPDDQYDCEENTINLEQNSDLKNKSGTFQLTDYENVTTTPCKKKTNLNYSVDPCDTDDKCASGYESNDSKSETMKSNQKSKREDCSLERATLQDTHILCHTPKHSATILENENRKYNTSLVPSKEVVSAQPHLSESCNLSSKKCHAENICFESPIDSKEIRQLPKLWQSIDIVSKLAGCNNTSTPYSSADSDACSKYDNNEEQLKGSPLHSSQYDKGTPPVKTCGHDYEKRSLDVSWVESYESHRNSTVHQSDGKDTRNYSEASKLPEHEITTCTMKEETLSRGSIPNIKSDFMAETLIQNWRDIMQSGTGSDVTIIASDGSSLAAHSLIFLARCPQLYEESKVYGNLIRWDNIPQKTAHHFLSYLYTGTCEVTTPGDPLWIELYDIALRYNCSDLVSYMELLYKAKSTPMKIPTVNLKRGLEPINSLVNLDSAVPLAGEVGKHTVPSEKTPIVNLEDLELRNSPANSISDSTNKFMTDSGKILKPTKLFSEKAHGKLGDRNPPENEVPKVDIFSPRGQEKYEHLQKNKGTQSPDLFDESLCFKSCITSTSLNIPPLTGIPQHSPLVKLVQSVPKELEKFFHIAPKTSSPCKLASSVEGKEDKKTMCNIPPSLILPITSEKDITGNEQAISGARLNLSLPSPSDRCELGDSDNDVIDLRHSGSEASVTDLPSISDCQTKTIYKDSIERMDCTDYENEEPPICESVDTHGHYISNIWDDFDTGDSHITFTEGLCSTSFKRATPSVCEEINSINELGSCVTPITQSSSHHVASTPLLHHGQDLPQRDMDSGTLQSTKSESRECLKLKTKYLVSADDSAEFTKGHPSDETLVNIAAEIDLWDVDNHQSENQTQSKLVTADNASCSSPATHHQMGISKRKLMTPQPDYQTMKSPDLKKELQKYGICTLGRRKAVVVLQHVYEQTHPFITDSEAETSFSQTPLRNTVIAADGPKLSKPQMGKKRCSLASGEQKVNKKIHTGKGAVKKSVAAVKKGETEMEESGGQLNSSLSSTSSESSSGYLFGEIVFPPEEESNSLSSTQQADLASQVREVIISNTDLHRKVLLYEPIFVEDLLAILKANKTKCSMQALLDVLDDLCLIVRTQANQNRDQTRTSKKRKKNSPRKKNQRRS